MALCDADALILLISCAVLKRIMQNEYVCVHLRMYEHMHINIKRMQTAAAV